MTTTAAPNRATVTTPSDREIRIERIFNAPRDVVWRAMTEPTLIAQWWGRGLCSVKALGCNDATKTQYQSRQ